MNKMKKFASMAAAILMTACVAVPATMSLTASAADIKINGISTTQEHTFEVYQIFTGDLSNDGKLSNLKWGSGVTSIKKDEITDWTATNGQTVSDDVVTYLTSVTDARNIIKNITLSETKACEDVTATNSDSVTISNLEDGYYVVKDVTDLSAKDDANSAWIVQVAGNVAVEIKNAKPTVDKQVLDEENDAEEGHANGWGESADHAINEQFKFKLIARVPAKSDKDMKAYKEYKLKFNDTMSKGVTFEDIESVTIKNGNKDITLSSTEYSEDATSATEKAGLKWSLTIEDIIKKLTDENGGVWGTNDLEVEVIYKAHLNENAVISNGNVKNSNAINNNKVDLEYSNNPDSTGAGGTDSTGKTPEDYVWVFTYEVDNTKYKNAIKEGNELEGAKFKLYDSTGKNEIELIYDDTLTAYRPIKTGETATEMKSAKTTGKFDIKGLDSGVYVLKEISAPEGYNKCADIEIKIGASHKEYIDGTKVSMTLSSDSNMKNDVINKEGSSLPSTGGIGTTLFYVCGGAMVAVSGIFLITKKRMDKNKD